MLIDKNRAKIYPIFDLKHVTLFTLYYIDDALGSLERDHVAMGNNPSSHKISAQDRSAQQSSFPQHPLKYDLGQFLT